MLKYTCKTLIERAKALADLKNSDFLDFGELFHYTNDAYRTVYQDTLNAGDQNYVETYRLEGAGSRVYDLPKDLYQVLGVFTDNGTCLNRKDYRTSVDDPGYSIENGKLYLSKVAGSVILKYFPVPETITYKAEPFEAEIPAENTILSSFGDKIIDNKGHIYDIKLGTYANEELESTLTDAILGAYSYVSNGTLYDFDHNELTLGNFLLDEDGNFIPKSDNFDLGVCSIDEGVVFLYKNSSLILYKDDKEVELDSDLSNVKQLRYVYFDGMDAVVVVFNDTTTPARIYFENGAFASLDSRNAFLLKTDTTTGYGFLTKKGNKYFIEGWLPDTKIDYPNNIFFSMVAYKLAMSFRIKQNADITLLRAEYDNLKKTYGSSLSVDGQSYPTIRNFYQNQGWW